MSEAKEWFEANRANWDERVPIHTSGEFYDVEGFKAGDKRLRSFEVEEVGDVSGKSLLHLQCHFGIDTLSWARREGNGAGLLEAGHRSREKARERHRRAGRGVRRGERL